MSYRRASRLTLAVLVAVLAIPLAVAVGAISEPQWYPSVDDAQTELRVRDVWTANPPLTGLGGRIGVYGPDAGSHPGPISFWSLSIVYRLFGMTSTALLASAASLNVVAMGFTLWLARRRGGLGLMLGAAAILMALAHAYGGYALTSPWNPFMPVMWWMVVLMGVWSLLCGDLPVLPLTIFACSFCMQTHISYAGLIGGLAILIAASVAYWIFVRRGDVSERRRAVTWTLIGIVVGVVAWFPPVAEQITGSQGHNLGKIVNYFGDPPEKQAGLAQGLDYVLPNLNPLHLFTDRVVDDRTFMGGNDLPGKLFLATWGVSILVSWRLRHQTLLRLHLLLAVVLVLGVASASRIFGAPWMYLALWAWGICAMLVLAVGWTTSALVARLSPEGLRSRLAAGAALGATLLLLVVGVQFTVDAAYVDVRNPELSSAIGELAPSTVAALEEGTFPGTGPDGRYLYTWNDPLWLGARAFSLLNELDRAGLDVGTPPTQRVAVTRHRVLAPEEASAQVHIATGADIKEWESKPGYHRIAYYDPTTRTDRNELDRLRRQITEKLMSDGHVDLARAFEQNPLAVKGQPNLPAELDAPLTRVIELSPVAVLVGPPSPTL